MSVLPCLFSSHRYAVFQGDPGDEGDIGEPGSPGLAVRQQNNPDTTRGLYYLICYCFSLYFQGENGNPGKPGPSGDPVRLLKAISLFIISGNM